jgi:hypothetical protein
MLSFISLEELVHFNIDTIHAKLGYLKFQAMIMQFSANAQKWKYAQFNFAQKDHYFIRMNLI